MKIKKSFSPLCWFQEWTLIFREFEDNNSRIKLDQNGSLKKFRDLSTLPACQIQTNRRIDDFKIII